MGPIPAGPSGAPFQGPIDVSEAGMAEQVQKMEAAAARGLPALPCLPPRTRGNYPTYYGTSGDFLRCALPSKPSGPPPPLPTGGTPWLGPMPQKPLK